MNHSEVIDTANKLTNENICQLINIFCDRFDVFVGTMDDICITSPVSNAFMSGATIQINLETSELKDMREDDWIHDACLTLFGDEKNQ
tara:strand:- start:156 stop:419 length:264 start_codon:yes stop_codon:yes gene_type:complete